MSSQKSAKQKNIPKPSKNTVQQSNPNAFYDLNPSWSFSKCDTEHDKWGFTCGDFGLDDVFSYLKGLEGQRWNEILTTTSGRSGNTRNHKIETYKLAEEAQGRLTELNLQEYDELYSIAMGGRLRLWGVINSGVFSIIWLDREHEIYKVYKH